MQKLTDAEQYVKDIPFLELPDFVGMTETLSAAKVPCEISEFEVGEQLFFDGYQISGWELCCEISIKFAFNDSKKNLACARVGKNKKRMGKIYKSRV